MTQAQSFREAVESGEFPLAEFNHSAHIKLAWLYLTQEPLPEAMIRFRDTLKKFAAGHGKTNIYHETITFAYLLWIHERIRSAPEEAGDWERFAASSQPVITAGRSFLMNYYRPDTLSSPEARSVFRLPDRYPAVAPRTL